jgi:hypothetical protein
VPHASQCGVCQRGGQTSWIHTCRRLRRYDRPVLQRPSRPRTRRLSVASVTRDAGHRPWIPCEGCRFARSSRRCSAPRRTRRAAASHREVRAHATRAARRRQRAPCMSEAPSTHHEAPDGRGTGCWLVRTRGAHTVTRASAPTALRSRTDAREAGQWFLPPVSFSNQWC